MHLSRFNLDGAATLNVHWPSARQSKRRRSLQQIRWPAQDKVGTSTTEKQKPNSKSAAGNQDADPEQKVQGGAQEILPQRKEKDHNEPRAANTNEDGEARTMPRSGSRAVVLLSTASHDGAAAPVDGPLSSAII